MKKRSIVNVLTIYSIVLGLFFLLESVFHYHSEQFIFLMFISLILMGLGIAGLVINIQGRLAIMKYFVIPIFIILIFLFHNNLVIDTLLLEKYFSGEFLLLTPVVFSVYFFLPEKGAGNNTDSLISNGLKDKKNKILELRRLRDDGLLTDEELEAAISKTLED